MKRFLSLAFCMLFVLMLTACAAPQKEEPFTYWTEDAAAITELKAYVEAVTDEKSADYIPVEDRIAIFDLDGTLYCETFPIYGEWILYSDYVLNILGEKAPDHLRAVAE